MVIECEHKNSVGRSLCQITGQPCDHPERPSECIPRAWVNEGGGETNTYKLFQNVLPATIILTSIQLT